MYGWWSRNTRVLRTVAVIGRVAPITLAAVSIALLQLDFTHKSFIVYLVVANGQCTYESVNPSRLLTHLLGSCRQLGRFMLLSTRHSGQVSAKLGFDEVLARPALQ